MISSPHSAQFCEFIVTQRRCKIYFTRSWGNKEIISYYSGSELKKTREKTIGLPVIGLHCVSVVKVQMKILAFKNSDYLK